MEIILHSLWFTRLLSIAFYAYMKRFCPHTLLDAFNFVFLCLIMKITGTTTDGAHVSSRVELGLKCDEITFFGTVLALCKMVLIVCKMSKLHSILSVDISI